MADIDLRDIHDSLIAIAKQAGERIVSATPSTDAAGSKKNCPYTRENKRKKIKLPTPI